MKNSVNSVPFPSSNKIVLAYDDTVVGTFSMEVVGVITTQ